MKILDAVVWFLVGVGFASFAMFLQNDETVELPETSISVEDVCARAIGDPPCWTEEFENISLSYGGIYWLSTRTHFNHDGLVIVGYDMFLAAVREVDEVLGELQSCQRSLDEVAGGWTKLKLQEMEE